MEKLLYLIVDPTGAKRRVLHTVVVKNKRRDIGLGGLSVASLAEAREEAARLRKIVRQHGDPLEERRKARRIVPTFEQVTRKFIRHTRYHRKTSNMYSNGLTR